MKHVFSLLISAGTVLAQNTTPNPWIGDWRVENDFSASFGNVPANREPAHEAFKIMQDGDTVRVQSTFELFEQGWHSVLDFGRCDGQWHATGGTAATPGTAMCRAKDSGTLEIESKSAAGLVIRRIWRISRDGRSIAALTEGENPQRGKYQDVQFLTKWQFAYYGKWKQLPQRSTVPELNNAGILIEPSPAGMRAVTYRKDGTQTSWETNLFGKETQLQGASRPTTIQVYWISNRSFEVLGKSEGKVTMRYKRTVSPQGRWMTTVGYTVDDSGVASPFSTVMEREQ